MDAVKRTARLVRSTTLSPVPRLISRSNRRAAADPMRIAKYAATAMMTMRRIDIARIEAAFKGETAGAGA